MTSASSTEQPSTRAFIGAISAFTLFAATLGALFVHNERWWIAFLFVCAIPFVIGMAFWSFWRFAIRTR